jgi:hypothetical protein
LNVAAIDAMACGTFLRSFFFVPARRAPGPVVLRVAIDRSF